MTLLKSTLAEQIYQILRKDILDQKIPMGEKLTLKILQDRFEVSSTPIRDALTRLAEDGLVVYYSNVGVNVISLTEDDLKNLYQFMGDLDALAIHYSFSNPDKEDLIAQLQHLLDETSSLESKKDMSETEIQQWIRNSDRFHLAFYDYCCNDYLKTAAEKLRSRLTIFSNIYEQDHTSQMQINAMHKQILKEYCNGNIERSCELMRNHLRDSLIYALAIIQNEEKVRS